MTVSNTVVPGSRKSSLVGALRNRFVMSCALSLASDSAEPWKRASVHLTADWSPSSTNMKQKMVRSSGHLVECWTIYRGDVGSIQPAAVLKFRQFRSPHIACVLEEALKTGGLFYLVSMPGEVKYPTQGVNV